MIRDVNNVRGALSKAAGMGRGSDNQMVHAGTGEVMIPPEVIDGNPQVMAPLIKAFQKAGMDWRRYLVGSEKNSKNPQTGAREFYPAGGGRAGGVGTEGVGGGFSSRDFDRDRFGGGGNRDSGPRDVIGFREGDPGYAGEIGRLEGRAAQQESIARRPTTLMDAISTLTTPGKLGGQMMADFRGALKMTPPQLRETFPRTYGPGPTSPADDPGRSRGRGDRPQTTIGQAAPPASPAPQPSYLEFAPGMTPLQQRTQIATYGLNSDDTRYQTPETQEYYKTLIRDELSQAGTMDILTPIEQQYLQQVLGLQFSDFNSLMAALGGGGAPGADTRLQNPGSITGPVISP